MMEVRVGDVVRGAFATKTETLIDHHSVVVDVKQGYAVIVYTTSLKPGDANKWKFSRAFVAHEMQMAGWSNPCRYDASQVAIVPVSLLTTQGRVPSKLLKELDDEMRKARAARCLVLNPYNANHPTKRTGFVSAEKRKAAV